MRHSKSKTKMRGIYKTEIKVGGGPTHMCDPILMHSVLIKSGMDRPNEYLRYDLDRNIILRIQTRAKVSEGQFHLTV